jgi:shikimate dehydrogenase
MENIILIGMPGCGKSTLGRKLAEQTEKTFVDMDALIEHEAGMTIPEIFEKYGEKHFRDLESAAAEKLGKEKSQIIATGGGVVLRPENMKALSQNGRVVFIQRPLEYLATKGRPLSKDPAALKNMYDVRFPLYNKYSDLTIHTQVSIRKDTEKLVDILGY